MLYLYKVIAIFLLCLFSSGCCMLSCTQPPKPKWAIVGTPTDGEGAVGCSRSYAGIPKRRETAIGVAYNGLAGQKGMKIVSVLELQATESGSTATLETSLGTTVTISAKTHRYWNDPNETCVWMKEVK